MSDLANLWGIKVHFCPFLWGSVQGLSYNPTVR